MNIKKILLNLELELDKAKLEAQKHTQDFRIAQRRLGQAWKKIDELTNKINSIKAIIEIEQLKKLGLIREEN
jgi:uncharacterized protein (DUF736 family)